MKKVQEYRLEDYLNGNPELQKEFEKEKEKEKEYCAKEFLASDEYCADCIVNKKLAKYKTALLDIKRLIKGRSMADKCRLEFLEDIINDALEVQ